MLRFEHKNPAGFEEKYRFDVKRYYRVFFSKYANIFLPLENQLRFIRMREANPSATLFFIYSSVCLNAEALKELSRFCSHHKIRPVDFDTEIAGIVKDERDQKLYAIAKEEIQKTIQHKNGNFAAASDCVRVIVPIIELYGIYTDFDVPCSLSQSGCDFAELRAPVLLSGEIRPALSNPDSYIVDSMHIYLNSDFLAFSLNRKTKSGLSTEALAAVRFIQAEIIKNYTQKFAESAVIKDILDDDLSPVLSKFLKTTPAEGKEHTVYDLRRFAATLQDEKLKYYLEVTSVAFMTGPRNYLVLYKQVYPDPDAVMSIASLDKDQGWAYLSLLNKSCIEYYREIAERYVTITNCNSQLLKPGKKKFGVLNDFSWHEKGETAQKIREQKITQIALLLQGMWRRKHNGIGFDFYQWPPKKPNVISQPRIDHPDIVRMLLRNGH